MANPIQAHDILTASAGHLADRAKTYDNAAGERSIQKTVNLFEILTGHELTEEQGWLFMSLLKLVRSTQGNFKLDNYEDAAAYCALMAEAAQMERSDV